MFTQILWTTPKSNSKSDPDNPADPADPADPAGQRLGQNILVAVFLCVSALLQILSGSYTPVKIAAYCIPSEHTPHTPTSNNYMQRNTHRYTHIHTKQDQPAQHSNKTKRFSFSSEEVEHKTKAESVNQSASFWCTNQKLVVWKANCLTQRCWFASGPFSRCTCTLYRFT